MEAREQCIISIKNGDRCTFSEPNDANTQWSFNSDGTIRIKSNPTLCMTGTTKPFKVAYLVTIERCTSGNAAQQFSYTNSTQYPFSTVSQGSNIVATTGSNIILTAGVSGTALALCNEQSSTDRFTFTGTGNTPGQLVDGQGQCVDGSCQCYPLSVAACNTSDTNQLWTYTSGKAFVNSASGQCLDVKNNKVALNTIMCF